LYAGVPDRYRRHKLSHLPFCGTHGAAEVLQTQEQTVNCFGELVASIPVGQLTHADKEPEERLFAARILSTIAILAFVPPAFADTIILNKHGVMLGGLLEKYRKTK
jgi:hypothetical protein